jgi:hypothetical protein
MNVVETNAWTAFNNVIEKLHGNHKDEDYKNIVRIVFKNFHILGCNMSLTVNFLFSHLNDGRLLLDVTGRCTQKKYTAGNQLKEVSSQSVKDAILIRNKKFS